MTRETLVEIRGGLEPPLPGGVRDIHMRKGFRAGQSPPWCAQNKYLAQQEGLVRILNGHGLLPAGVRQRRQPHGVVWSNFTQVLENSPVDLVETSVVHTEKCEGFGRQRCANRAPRTHLHVVTDTSQEAVRHAWSSAAPRRNNVRSELINRNVQYRRRALYDFGQRLDGLEVELANETETVSERSRDETCARGGSEQREGRNFQSQ